MMGAMDFGKKFAEFLFDESDELVEQKSRWRSTKSSSGKKKKKKKSLRDYSPIDNYQFLESFASGMKPEEKKSTKEPVIVHDIDEAVKERIFRSDAALQSSSSNNTLKAFSGSRSHGFCTSYHGDSFSPPRSLKTATDGKASGCTQRLHLADIESVSIISDEDNDNLSTMSSNDLADAEGSLGEQNLEQEITSDEMDSSVVINPKYVIYGGNCYQTAHLTFFPSSIKLNVLEEEGPTGTLTFEWKIVDLISIESRWLDHFITAGVYLHIKSEHAKLADSGQKSGILEVTFAVCDPSWTCNKEQIKFLNEHYKEKWEVDLDLYEPSEDITYLEGDCDSICISKRDFQLLQPEKFINDTIVDFYIEYLKKKKIKPADGRVHFFNSFFFRKLADFDENRFSLFEAKEAFQRVRKWTKKVNIFQMEYIFIPVNFSLHWSLIVICHPGEVVNFTDEELANSPKVPCILHMDSIKGSHRGLENCIRCYLWEEWKERSGDAAEDISRKFMNLRFLPLEVPQQQNSYDCGLFMLHYMELFVKQAPIDFNPLNNFISKAWFHPKEAYLKRAHIKSLIFELAKTNSQQRLSSDCNDDKLSYELKDEDEEEADVQFLHEICDSEEICHGNISDTCANGSREMTNSKVHMDINLLDDEANGHKAFGLMTSSLEELPSHCKEFQDTGDDGGSSIAANDQNHGQLVPYDHRSQVVSSPIKESHETEDVRHPLTNAKTIKTDFVAITDKCLDLLRLEGPSSKDDDVRETLYVEDSDERCSSSSSDDVYETCVVEDSDSDDLGATSSIRKDVAGKYLGGNRRRRSVDSEARKRLKRSDWQIQ